MIKRLVDYNDKSSEEGDRQARRSPDGKLGWNKFAYKYSVAFKVF